MCVLETVAHKLSVQGHGWQRGSGVGPEISSAELAGMLAGLPEPAVWLAYARLTEDAAAGRALYARLHVMASEWSHRDGWAVPRGSERVGKLARLVRDDLVLPRPLLSERAASEWIGVSRRQWRQAWQGRHAALLAVGMNWEWALRRKLSRELWGRQML